MRSSKLRLITFLLAATLSNGNIPSYSKKTLPPYDYGVSRSLLLKRQTTEPYITTGVHSGQGPNGSLPLRLEVRELEKDPTSWALYILGLDMLQHTSQTEMLSWYQLSGIHGLPFVPFNGAQPKPGDEENGYCTHVSILFPTWHRPYIATYEQIIYGLVQEIAQMYPKGPIRDKYMAAASKLRVPYWDWAAIRPNNESIFPQSIGGSPAIVIDGPAGVQTIANPLYSYRFQPLDPEALPDFPFNQYSETLRSPTSNDALAVSRNDVVATRLDSSALSIRSRLYNLLTNYHDYSKFSNEAWISASSSGYDSLESIHDQIHGLTGDGGHMSYIYYAAFDPIFWLHHAMLDRCFIMWQVLNPDSFVVPTNSSYSTFTMTAGDIQDVNSALTPFYKDDSRSFWTSADVRTTDVFGYQYPETSNFTGANITRSVISAINQLYGSSTSLKERDQTTRQRLEWVVNVIVRKLALNGPFLIYIFIGPFSADSTQWSYDANLAGTHSIFAKMTLSNSSSDCDEATMVAATLPITHALLKHIDEKELRSLDPDDVEPYLTDNLQFRLTFVNGTQVENAKVPSLKILVGSVTVRLPIDDWELPVWGEMESHLAIKIA